MVIKPNAALTLSLVLHELATNAAKHGVLTSPHGQVSVAVAVGRMSRRDSRPASSWSGGERDGPSVAPADQAGLRLASDRGERRAARRRGRHALRDRRLPGPVPVPPAGPRGARSADRLMTWQPPSVLMVSMMVASPVDEATAPAPPACAGRSSAPRRSGSRTPRPCSRAVEMRGPPARFATRSSAMPSQPARAQTFSLDLGRALADAGGEHQGVEPAEHRRQTRPARGRYARRTGRSPAPHADRRSPEGLACRY